MAIPTLFLGTEATLINSIVTGASGGTSQPNELYPYQYEGRVRVSCSTITLAAQTAGVYGIAILPKGAKILRIRSVCSVLIPTTTIALGIAGYDNSGYISVDTTVATGVNDATGANVFRAAATLATATTWMELYDGVGATSGYLNYVTEKQVWLIMTTATGTALPASGTWKIVTEYVTD